MVSGESVREIYTIHSKNNQSLDISVSHPLRSLAVGRSQCPESDEVIPHWNNHTHVGTRLLAAAGDSGVKVVRAARPMGRGGRGAGPMTRWSRDRDTEPDNDWAAAAAAATLYTDTPPPLPLPSGQTITCHCHSLIIKRTEDLYTAPQPLQECHYKHAVTAAGINIYWLQRSQVSSPFRTHKLQ